MRVFRSNEFLQSIPNSSKILGLNATPEYEKSPAKKLYKKIDGIYKLGMKKYILHG